MYTIEEIKRALSHVDDPDLKKDLVSLNMIENIKIEQNRVSFDLVLTTIACPFKKQMKEHCIAAIHHHISQDIEVEVALKSKGSKTAEQANYNLSQIKHFVAVAAGKGGVGKSTVAANLAVALAKTGAKVGLVDADIYGPSVPIMFDLPNETPNAKTTSEGQNYLLPIEKYNVKLMSIGFFVKNSQATVWRGPMASNMLRQIVLETEWGELDYLIIDMPPGTGDIQLTLAQIIPNGVAVLVTTPQQVALEDVRKAADMFNSAGINIPLLGVIENMSYFTPAELPENKYYIFGKEGGKLLAEELNVPLLAQLPIVQSIAESGDKGCPVAMDEGSMLGQMFQTLVGEMARYTAIQSYKL